MKNLIWVPLMAILVLAQSCTKDVLEGEGPVKTETRALESFSVIDISGNRHIEIVKSVTRKVEITGYQNLVEAYKSNQAGEYLTFGFVNTWWVKNDNIRLKIFTPDLREIRLSGNHEVMVGQGFSFSGFTATITGNSKLYFEPSTAEKLNIKCNGNGEVFARDLSSGSAEVELNGNGIAEVRANNLLKVKIAGNGEVHYWGNPEVSSRISGNGKTIAH